MKALLTILLSGLIATNATAVNTTHKNNNDTSYNYATVDRIEEGYAALEVCLNDKCFSMVDVPQEDFIIPKNEGDKFKIETVKGKFYTSFIANDYHGKTENLYQFCSDDNSVWWALTEEEIGHIPDDETEYTIIYYDNGTTAENKPCDCMPEWECECEVYDDIFLEIIANI